MRRFYLATRSAGHAAKPRCRLMMSSRREAAMRKGIATTLLLVSLSGFVPTTAHASAGVDAALALGSFAVFNQILAGFGLFGWPRAYAAPAYYAPYSFPAPAHAH